MTKVSTYGRNLLLDKTVSLRLLEIGAKGL